ncbi:MAG: HAD family hydrolase [Clostridia bacterium]|nr:HAD family hydrolase [Clostridia bacterium]
MKNMLIFDLDGTLWDASGEILDAWNICFTRMNLHPITHTDLCDNLGKPLAEMLANLFPEESQQTRDALLPICSDFELDYLRKTPVKPFPGVYETLLELQRLYDLRFGIVSNCQKNYIEIFLDSCGFPELFIDRECSGNTGLSKGQNILLVKNRCLADRCIYVGDAQTDADGAAEAGVPFIHAAYGFGHVARSDASVRSFPDLLAAVPPLLER